MDPIKSALLSITEGSKLSHSEMSLLDLDAAGRQLGEAAQKMLLALQEYHDPEAKEMCHALKVVLLLAEKAHI